MKFLAIIVKSEYFLTKIKKHSCLFDCNYKNFLATIVKLRYLFKEEQKKIANPNITAIN